MGGGVGWGDRDTSADGKGGKGAVTEEKKNATK